MMSYLRFSFTILFISRASIIDGNKLATNKIRRYSRTIIAGGIIPEGDGNYNHYNRLPQHNGAQNGYFNHIDRPNDPYLSNTNSYGKYPGGYYENEYWNHENPLRSAWEWITDALSYCFSYNHNSGFNNYYHSGYNRQEPMRANSLSHGLLRSED